MALGTLTKWMVKIAIQWVVALVGGVVGGVFGLVIGTNVGGLLDMLIGFPQFGGAPSGLEAGGILFAVLGIALGSFAGALGVQMFLQESTHIRLALIAALVTFAAVLPLYHYNAPHWRLALIPILPPTLAVITMHWPRLRLAFKGGVTGPIP